MGMDGRRWNELNMYIGHLYGYICAMVAWHDMAIREIYDEISIVIPNELNNDKKPNNNEMLFGHGFDWFLINSFVNMYRK